MESANIGPTRLAQSVGLKQPSISRLMSGETRTTRVIADIARALSTNVDYLTGQSDDPGPASTNDTRLPFRHAPAPPPDDDSVMVQQFDIALGMGGGGYLDNAVGEPMRFSRSWIRQFTKAPPEKLLWTSGMGDSMAPTINEADVMLIDTTDRTPRISDKIWAIDHCGLGMVKRLRASAHGMRILSDNPLVPEDVAVDGEMQVFGRVVAVVRRF